MVAVVHSTKPVRGFGLRLIELGPCGEVIATTKNRFEITDFTQVVSTPSVYAGVEIKSYDAQGRPTLIDTPQPYIEFETVEVTTDIANPVLLASLGGGAQIIQPTSLDVLGFKNPGPLTPAGNVMSLEVWQKPAGGLCGVGAISNYVHVWPLVKSWVNSTATTIGNAARSYHFTGKAYPSTQWGLTGKGPVLVLAGTAIYAAEVVAALDGPHDEFLTTIPPPSTAIGAVTITPIPLQA